MLIPLLSLALLSSIASGDTITYNWSIGTITNNPDGYTRTTLGINNLPPYGILVEGNLGDTVVVYVTNNLPNPTAIHWHGILQQGTNNMDGPVGVTQCEIPAGSTYKYQYNLNNTGTYWFHSHYKDQYLDGLRGPMVVRDPNDPNLSLYDEEMVVLLEDWYHSDYTTLETLFAQSQGDVVPIWQSGLINGRGQYKWTSAEASSATIKCASVDAAVLSFTAGKRYRLRIINASGFAAFNFTIAGHAMSVIESDGINLKPSALVTNLFINIAQRYSVVVTADQAPGNYTISCPMRVNIGTNTNNIVTGVVQYASSTASGTYPSHTTAYYDESMGIPLVSSVPQKSTKSVTFAFNFGTNTTDNNRYAFVSLNGGTA